MALLLIFGAGIAASQGALGELFDFMFASIQGETEKYFTKDVKPEQKAAFDAEMKKMRAAVRANKLSVDRLQPFLRTLRDASEDERVTPQETERLIREIREANRTVKR